MIAIPLPFVVALLLSILMILLFIRREESTNPTFIFLAICVLATTVVGLRWTYDYQLFRLLQPILASCIPAAAWYCFSSAHNRQRFRLWHLLPPVLVTLSSFTYTFWRPPLDPVLTLLYIAYGIALIHSSSRTSSIPELVRLSEIDNALKAQRFAGFMLLMSAVIDGALAFDFAFYAGEHVLTIITIGHAVLLPTLTIVVIMFSLSIAPSASEEPSPIEKEKPEDKPKDKPQNQLTENEIKDIVSKVDNLFTAKEVFLDPDLTLDRLARKVGIPAKQISAAINQVHGRNVSQVVNEYRIERAKTLLATTDKTITQIYFDSGFQTKSNFNREFTRVTQQTPSAFRRSQQEKTA